MVNSSISNIVGIGDLCIQTNIDCILTSKDMQHVLDLHLILTFVHALDLAGYCTTLVMENEILPKVR